jgi:pilus assembly protein CpaF
LHGIIDKLLPEGLRVLVVLGPHAVRGPCAVITKPRRSGPSLEAFTSSGLLSEAVAETLRFALRARRNILVTGPNPELILQILAALGRAAPEGERVIAVSERAPFELAREEAVLLQAQPPELSLRRAVQGALQMVADRLIVSDLRGGEIFDLISAMPRGREAILVGMQAPSRLSALQRMESLVLASGELPAALGRELVATAVPLVLEVAMAPTGRPRLEKSGKQFALTPLFSWKREGGSNQTGVGRIVPSGTVPSFCDELKKQGVSVPASLFRA